MTTQTIRVYLVSEQSLLIHDKTLKFTGFESAISAWTAEQLRQCRNTGFVALILPRTAATIDDQRAAEYRMSRHMEPATVESWL